MALDDDFAAAQQRAQQLSKRPSDGVLLELYGLFKQATTGDATGKRPGMLDVRGRRKYDAWATRRGMGADAAKQAYVDRVDRLVAGG